MTQDTDRELMRQALEALENLQGLCTDADDGWVEAVTIWTPEIIKALRERLAQPEGAIIPHLPGICCKTGTCDREQPVQEPVAEIVEDDFSRQVVGIGRWHRLPNGTKLYTSPPKPRQWQGLTPREIELIDGMIEAQLQHAEQCDRIGNRTMAEKQKGWDMERVALLHKLREKNS